MRTFIFVLLTILFWGVSPVVEKLGLVKVSPLIAVTIRSVFIAAFLLGVVLASGNVESLVQVDRRSLFFVILGGILAGLLGQLTYFYALKGDEASKVAPLASAYPLVTAFLGIFLLGEGVSGVKILGVILIVAGVWFLK